MAKHVGVQAYTDRLRAAGEGSAGQDSIADYFLNRFTAEALNNIQSLTPVDTGNLRNGFTAGREITGDVALYEYAKKHPRQGNGRVKSMTISNPVDYAVYVENGHRTPPGQSNTVNWVEGQFMVRDGLKHVEKFAQQLGELYMSQYIKNFLS